jgi:hypothetical protein
MAKKKQSRKAKKSDKGMYIRGSTDQKLSAHQLGDENFIAQGIVETHASRELRHSVGSTTNIIRREGYNRNDYDRQRPGDALPVKHADIIKACQGIYRKIGLVRNVIDLMADFASEGLILSHPIKSQEIFYREWARRVDLQGRVHDFMRLILRDANIIIRRKNAKLPNNIKKQWSKGEDVILPDKKVKKNNIPWEYIFFSPVSLQKLTSSLAQFAGINQPLVMNIDPKMANLIKNPKTDADKAAIAKLPKDILNAIQKGEKVIPLDMDNIYVAHYKKDDWENWATPFLYAILDDIMFKEKMRTADMAALDGVINVIRLWKLGKSDKEILPTSTAVNKLIGILENNYGGGTLDLVWDDMIDLQVEYPPIDQILGNEKYEGVNSDIVLGLGIPQTLIGAGDTAKNAQSAFIQLKTLVERLEYVRMLAIKWLQTELKMVADAMGFKKIPNIMFGTMSLRDESKEKQLMIQLMDRGVISIESVQKAFGKDFIIELERLRREQKIRDKKPPIIERAGPYYRPESLMEKEAELKEGSPDNQNPTPPESPDDKRKTDKKQPGRPPNQDDKKPRDQRHDPVYSLDDVLNEHVAESLMTQIDKIIDPKFLSKAKVKTIRQLSSRQRSDLELSKWSILCALHGDEEKLTEEIIGIALDNLDKASFKRINTACRAYCEAFVAKMHRKPTLQERRRLMATAWSKKEVIYVSDSNCT